MKNLLSRVILVLAASGMSLFLAVTSHAQASDPTNLHEVCTSLTVCSSGPTTLVTTAGLPTFDITFTPSKANSGSGLSGNTGELYLAIVVPNSNNLPASFTVDATVNGTPGSFTASATVGSYSSGDLITSLGAIKGNTNGHNFGAISSAATQSGIAAPGSFTVYIVNLGAIPSSAFTSGATLATVTGYSGISGLPLGTQFYVLLGNGASSSIVGATIVNSSPFSESITGGSVTPEPASLALFGVGLVVFGGFLRRRKTAA